MPLQLAPLPDFSPAGPVVLCILDGYGLGRPDDGNAIHVARTPVFDRLWSEHPHTSVLAHGTAVGLPSDGDMGNSEVGHNALGAGRVFAQGAKLVNAAIATGHAFRGEVWPWLTSGGTLHLLGLVSDGNVHSHIDHVHALVDRALADGVERLRLHVLTDGRDVDERSALRWVEPLEAKLAACPGDYAIASGGGRMHVTMDRYEADWAMVERGVRCHGLAQGRRFASASEAIRTLYAEAPEVNDQYLPAFVVGDYMGFDDGDAVLFFNFRGDRALEISRVLEGRSPLELALPAVRYAGIMQYDGDEQIPRRYLVEPPAIDRTVGDHLAANGRRTYAISETQKYGHVTYFFNGNKSGYLDAQREQYVEVPSDVVPFETAPEMKAERITSLAVEAIASGRYDHVRLNLANGDMVGHTGDFEATVAACETLDACLARLEAATLAAGGTLVVTADHGNADQMFELEGGAYKLVHGQRVKRTAHSLNPVPFVVVDAARRWQVLHVEGAGLANIGSSLLTLAGLVPPDDFEPSLVALR